MKKFLSMVMAAAMVASLVPATAFAAGDVKATAKVIDALDTSKVSTHDGVINEANFGTKVPELRLDITSANYRETLGGTPTVDVTVSLDNATFLTGYPYADNDALSAALKALVTVYDEDGNVIIGIPADSSVAPTPEVLGTIDTTDHSADIAVPTGKKDGFRPADIVYDSAADEFADAATGSGEATEVTTGKASVLKQYELDNTKVFTAKTPNAAGAAVTIGGVEVIAAAATVISDDPATGQPYTTAKLIEMLEDGALVDADKCLLFGGSAAVDATWTAANAFALAVKNYNADKTGDDVLEVGTVDTAYAPAVNGSGANKAGVETSVKEWSLNRNGRVEEVTYTFTGRFAKDWSVIVDLVSTMDKDGQGKTATVSVDSDMVDANDLVYVSVLKKDISASIKKTASVAEEEMITLESDLKIKASVDEFVADQWFELKLSKGFEFDKLNPMDAGSPYYFAGKDGNTVYMEYTGADTDEITIDNEDIKIEATSAKSGATCTLTVRALDKEYDASSKKLITTTHVPKEDLFSATATVEIAKVVDYKVVLSVDEDEDVPVIYSGVNVDNYGITDDSDHLSLEVTAEETFPGAWSMRKGFNFELPEHVYVTKVDVIDTDNFYYDAYDVEVEEVEAAFWDAYQDGSHVNFEFKKRVFDDVDSNLRDKECAEMTFQLELVADPGFEGDVVLKLTGDLVDEQEVTIAKFVKPYTVKAEQNDLIIDYRYTDIPTAITITEAEKGLWAKNEATFRFAVEKQDYIVFEDDPTFEIDSKSDLEIKNDGVKDGEVHFTVKTESDEAATVTMKDMQLFMQRSIPAGPYDLEIGSSLADAYERQVLWAPDELNGATFAPAAQGGSSIPDITTATAWALNANRPSANTVAEDTYVYDVCDYSTTVKEAFVNVVTAGRDVDDASFTTKVVVPVGENYIVAGEKQVELDTPAYINAAGYTMLPIRAVATALGINNSNVLWDQPTKTVTILYGQRIITMTQGQKVVYVNGSAIPASAAVENTNSRTFLPMRDLATALGVTDITWDQATRTATLNGNQK